MTYKKIFLLAALLSLPVSTHAQTARRIGQVAFGVGIAAALVGLIGGQLVRKNKRKPDSAPTPRINKTLITVLDALGISGAALVAAGSATWALSGSPKAPDTNDEGTKQDLDLPKPQNPVALKPEASQPSQTATTSPTEPVPALSASGQKSPTQPTSTPAEVEPLGSNTSPKAGGVKPPTTPSAPSIAPATQKAARKHIAAIKEAAPTKADEIIGEIQGVKDAEQTEEMVEKIVASPNETMYHQLSLLMQSSHFYTETACGRVISSVDTTSIVDTENSSRAIALLADLNQHNLNMKQADEVAGKMGVLAKMTDSQGTALAIKTMGRIAARGTVAAQTLDHIANNCVGHVGILAQIANNPCGSAHTRSIVLPKLAGALADPKSRGITAFSLVNATSQGCTGANDLAMVARACQAQLLLLAQTGTTARGALVKYHTPFDIVAKTGANDAITQGRQVEHDITQALANIANHKSSDRETLRTSIEALLKCALNSSDSEARKQSLRALTRVADGCDRFPEDLAKKTLTFLSTIALSDTQDEQYRADVIAVLFGHRLPIPATQRNWLYSTLTQLSYSKTLPNVVRDSIIANLLKAISRPQSKATIESIRSRIGYCKDLVLNTQSDDQAAHSVINGLKSAACGGIADKEIGEMCREVITDLVASAIITPGREKDLLEILLGRAAHGYSLFLHQKLTLKDINKLAPLLIKKYTAQGPANHLLCEYRLVALQQIATHKECEKQTGAKIVEAMLGYIEHKTWRAHRGTTIESIIPLVKNDALTPPQLERLAAACIKDMQENEQPSSPANKRRTSDCLAAVFANKEITQKTIVDHLFELPMHPSEAAATKASCIKALAGLLQNPEIHNLFPELGKTVLDEKELKRINPKLPKLVKWAAVTAMKARYYASIESEFEGLIKDICSDKCSLEEQIAAAQVAADIVDSAASESMQKFKNKDARKCLSALQKLAAEGLQRLADKKYNLEVRREALRGLQAALSNEHMVIEDQSKMVEALDGIAFAQEEHLELRVDAIKSIGEMARNTTYKDADRKLCVTRLADTVNNLVAAKASSDKYRDQLLTLAFNKLVKSIAITPESATNALVAQFTPYLSRADLTADHKKSCVAILTQFACHNTSQQKTILESLKNYIISASANEQPALVSSYLEVLTSSPGREHRAILAQLYQIFAVSDTNLQQSILGSLAGTDSDGTQLKQPTLDCILTFLENCLKETNNPAIITTIASSANTMVHKKQDSFSKKQHTRIVQLMATLFAKMISIPPADVPEVPDHTFDFLSREEMYEECGGTHDDYSVYVSKLMGHLVYCTYGDRLSPADGVNVVNLLWRYKDKNIESATSCIADIAHGDKSPQVVRACLKHLKELTRRTEVAEDAARGLANILCNQHMQKHSAIYDDAWSALNSLADNITTKAKEQLLIDPDHTGQNIKAATTKNAIFGWIGHQPVRAA